MRLDSTMASVSEISRAGTAANVDRMSTFGVPSTSSAQKVNRLDGAWAYEPLLAVLGGHEVVSFDPQARNVCGQLDIDATPGISADGDVGRLRHDPVAARLD